MNPFDFPLFPPEEEETEQEAKKEEPADAPVQKAGDVGGSSLDAVLAAVTGERRGTVRKEVCACGSTQFRRYAPLEGGVATRRCRKCRREEPVASVVTAAPIRLPTAQLPVGPFHGPSRPLLNRYDPKFRMMSTLRGDDDER